MPILIITDEAASVMERVTKRVLRSADKRRPYDGWAVSISESDYHRLLVINGKLTNNETLSQTIIRLVTRQTGDKHV